MLFSQSILVSNYQTDMISFLAFFLLSIRVSFKVSFRVRFKIILLFSDFSKDKTYKHVSLVVGNKYRPVKKHTSLVSVPKSPFMKNVYICLLGFWPSGAKTLWGQKCMGRQMFIYYLAVILSFFPWFVWLYQITKLAAILWVGYIK